MQRLPETQTAHTQNKGPARLFSILGAVLAAVGSIPGLAMGAVLVFPQPAAAEGPAKLTVTITDIKTQKGALMIAVYDEAGYDKDVQAVADMIPVTGTTATATFQLPAGKYGIKMFHDVDGDGKMGANPFGMPIEPFAFSNNAPAKFGPASWADAAFDVAAPATSHTIKLN